MLISHKHKFVTIDIPKTGTRTLRETLTPIGAVDFSGKGDDPKDFFYQHTNLIKCQKGFVQNGWDINDYTIFSMIRDPWKRYASFLLYKLSKIKKYEEASDEEKQQMHPLSIREASALFVRFDSFGRDVNSFFKFIIERNQSQDYFLLDENGVLAIDVLGSMEKIEESFNTFCDAVNISPTPKLKHSNKSVYSKPYFSYYIQELIDMVAEKEKWVIGEFGYDFV